MTINSVPNPWKLYQQGNQITFQLGKKPNFKLEFVHSFTIKSWQMDDFWLDQWQQETELSLKSEHEVIYSNIHGFELAQVTCQSWTPVYVWIRHMTYSDCIFKFNSELSRINNDLQSLKQLLNCFQSVS